MHTGQRFDHPALIRQPSVGHNVNGIQSPKHRFVVGCILVSVMILLCAVCFIQAQDDPYRGQRSPESQAKVDDYFKKVRSIGFGRQHIQDVPTDSFVDLEFEDVAHYQKLRIYNRLCFLLQDEVHPQPKSKAPPPSTMKGEISREEAVAGMNRPALHHLKPGRMAVRVFAAYEPSQCDLVEYRWEHEGLHLRVLAALEVVRLDLDLDEVSQAARTSRTNTRAYLRDLLPKLVRLKGQTKTVPSIDYDVDVPLPDDLVEGVEFSSNPEKPFTGMDIYRWYERIDGFVESGHLAFLFYMKPLQRPEFEDASKWFDDEFRQLVHQKAREQGKFPPETPKADE